MKYPKPHRIVNKEAIEKVRSFGVCMMQGRGECWGGLEVHHVKSRGSGGDDTVENMVLLCVQHHRLIHMGKITPREVKERREFLQRIDWIKDGLDGI